MDKSEAIALLEQIAAEQKRILVRNHLIDFTKWTFQGYEINEHHRRYAEVLDRFSRGKIKNLMVFMPPQHGKSELCSSRLPAKLLGDNPDLRIALTSYNHSFASRFNRDVQRIIDDEKYRQLYPGTQLSGVGIRSMGSWLRNADEFEIIDHKGSFVSVGVGGGLTGRTVDIGIVDDPYKDAQDAWSTTVRQSVQDWYDTVFKTRLHNDSQQLITQTRWHPDDLSGTILKREPENWHVVIFPAIKVGQPSAEDPREEGEALWPARHSLTRLLEVKRQNPHVFGSLYQQDPKPAEGLLFPVESLNRFTLEDIKTDGDYHKVYIAAIDLADKGKDFYCMLVAVLFEHKIYVIDCIFTQAPIDTTEPLTIAMLKKHKTRRCRIESNAGGEIYCSNLKKAVLRERITTHIDPVFTTANKETRILLSSGSIKQHMWFRSDIAPKSDYAKFIDNLTGYTMQGKNEHDDGPDCATMIIELITDSGLRGYVGF